MAVRQVVLDTETTGLSPDEGHRIIEIGCVELINRRVTDNTYHQYLQPQRPIDPGATAVHGITDERLANEPTFAQVVDEFLAYLGDSELVIHNAPFDVGFIDAELRTVGRPERIAQLCEVIDTLPMARRMHPGQRNSLDALCRRYGVDNSSRQWHGALLDAQLLAEVYLGMTGGQGSLLLEANTDPEVAQALARSGAERGALPVIQPTPEEHQAHRDMLELIEQHSGACLWLQQEQH